MVRDTLSSVLRDADADNLIIPKREHSYRWFSDKLSPARRWLRAQVGRPWSKVRGELFARFDIRTTPGRHIVFDHMLAWIEQDSTRRRRSDLWIDDHGLLRATPESPRRERGQYPQACSSMQIDELERWLDNRRVGKNGDILFWLVCTPFGAFRQHHRMSAQDVARWNALPAHYREHHNGD